MTSSTSSSDQRINHTSPDDHQRYHARRAMAIKTILFGGGAMLLALLLVNGVVYLLRSEFPNPFSVQRIQTAAENLPAALSLPADDKRKVVYVLGSSLIEFGFSPDIFDQEMKRKGEDVVSYNFGYGNADPSIHKRFTHRLEEDFAGQGKKIDLLVFEFSPFQATRRRAMLTGQLNNAAHAVLGDWQDFWQVAKHDHDKAVSLINTRYLRNGVPAEAITNLLAIPIRNAGRLEAKVKDSDKEPLDQLGWQLYHQLMKEWPQAHPPGGWYKENRGGLPPTASPEAMALAARVMQRMQNPDRMQASREQRRECCDVENLEFDPKMIEDLIVAIKQAQKVSKRVDLLLMPRNQDVIKLTPQGLRNLHEVVKHIQAETGVRLVDFSESPYYHVDQFFDADHLSLFKGRTRLSKQLADYYADDADF